MNKDQVSSGKEIWAEQYGMGRLKPRREIKLKGKNGDRERKCSIVLVKKNEENIGA